MYNQPDEEFDRLCREAAENPECHPSADGWDKLRRKLDREMPEKPDRRPGWLLWLPFLISLPLAMAYWLQFPASGKDLSSLLSVLKPVQQTDKAASKQQPGFTSTNTRNGSPAKESPSPGTSAATLEQSLATAPHTKLPENQAGSQTEGTHNESSLGRNPQANSKNAGDREQMTAGQFTAPPRRKSGQPPAKKLDRPKSDLGRKPEQLEQRRDAEQAAEAEDNESVNRELVQASSLPADVKDSSVQGLAKSSAATPEPLKATSRDSAATKPPQATTSGPIANNKGFGFMAVFGPDFSNVHFDAGSKSGFSVGMLLEYHFNKRLSLQSGMIYEKKNYTAMGDAYGKIPGYDVNDPNFKMNKVDAHCFMWEIPVNVRYNFVAGNQHRVFAATGFSTYLMRKEDLHYYYTHYNLFKYKKWMNDQSSAYWFAVANLSVGYEYRINQMFSIQADPYFKIPVKGMGYGTVPVNSMGILFGIRYRPLKSAAPSKK
jgi:hypothetical protein